MSLSSRVTNREETRLYEASALPNGDNQGLETSDKGMPLVSLLRIYGSYSAGGGLARFPT